MPALDTPAYALVGSGYWSERMAAILQSMGRHCIPVKGVRQLAGEDADSYVARLAERFATTGASAAWLCVPPGDHVASIVRAALAGGLHVVAEKPWLVDASTTRDLSAAAAAAGRLVAVHFEYCLLAEVAEWREVHRGGDGLAFGGEFVVSRSVRQRRPAAHNLGSHLFAIRRYAVGAAEVTSVSTSYVGPPSRRAWLDDHERRLATADFTNNDEPVIQRFVVLAEDAMNSVASRCPFGLDFAAAVARDVESYALLST